MKALIQRVKCAKLSVDDKTVSEIGKGLVVFYCVDVGDEESRIEYYAKKIANMRIFEKDNKMNLSVLDVGGEVLLVSQFTLAGRCERGNRPDFILAEKPDRANDFYIKLGKALEALGVKVKYGVFGADMLIEQANDGPVSIIL